MDILKIVEDLGIEVKGVSNNEISAYCPLHDDSTPSLCINLETGLHQCWAGCTSGDIFALISNVLNISRKEAREKYEEDNWEIDLLKKNIEDFLHREQKIIPLREFPESLSDFGFVDASDCEYLIKTRRLSPEVIKTFEIAYNSFTETVAIPVQDEKGKLAGYIYRWTIEHKPKVKYSIGLQKNDILFGIPQLDVKKLEKNQTITLVEGAFDAINLRQHGVNALAILGCEISENQIKILKGLCNTVHLALDNDEAGRKAENKIERELSRDFIIWNVYYEGKDPGELTKEQVEEYFEK